MGEAEIGSVGGINRTLCSAATSRSPLLPISLLYFFASTAVTASSRPSSEWPPHTLRPERSYSRYVGVPEMPRISYASCAS